MPPFASAGKNLNSFQTIVHAQHQFRNGATGNQWDSALPSRLSAVVSQSRANRKLRARFPSPSAANRVFRGLSNGSGADNRFRHVFSDSANSIHAQGRTCVTSRTRTPRPPALLAIGTACSSLLTIRPHQPGRSGQDCFCTCFPVFIGIFFRLIGPVCHLKVIQVAPLPALDSAARQTTHARSDARRAQVRI